MSSEVDFEEEGDQLNKQVDPTLGTSTSFKGESGDIALPQVLLITGFLVLFVVVFCFCFRSRIPSMARRVPLLGRLVEPTKEELEARQAYIDENLPVRIWDEKNPENDDDLEKAESCHTDEDKKVMDKTADESDDMIICDPKAGEDLNEETDPTCSICLVEYESGDKMSWSTNKACSHQFHMDCIKEWLLKHKECPMCRKVFLPEPEKSEEVLDVNEEDNADNEVPAAHEDDSRNNEDVPGNESGRNSNQELAASEDNGRDNSGRWRLFIPLGR